MAALPETPRRLERAARRTHTCMVPQPLGHRPGLVLVDSTWGRIQPLTVAPGVRTVGELEVLAHLEAGGAVIDTRQPRHYHGGTIPGAVGIPHEEIVGRIDEIARDRPTVFFCNGPQCAATPDAIRRLLAAGHPAELILYYRGGIHDWMTLGLPTRPGR